jgi:hypothetical protein
MSLGLSGILEAPVFNPAMDARASDFGFAAFRSRITSPALLAIADHWQEARGDALMPSWSQIRPSCIAPHLTRVWSFRYDRQNNEFTGRLAGNRIMAGFNKSFRGTPLKELHAPPVLEQVHANLLRLVLEPCIYRSTGKLFRQGVYTSEGERIALPLADDGSHGDGALGASEYDPVPAAVAGQPVVLIHDLEEWHPLV